MCIATTETYGYDEVIDELYRRHGGPGVYQGSRADFAGYVEGYTRMLPDKWRLTRAELDVLLRDYNNQVDDA
jgi:hypothetical protein